MKKHWRFIFYSVLMTILFLMPQTYASLSNSQFTGAEHVIMGNEIALRFDELTPAQSGYIFELPSGLSASYGDIISIGDLYGYPEKPISQPHAATDRANRFMHSFDLFAVNTDHLSESKKILATVHEEQRLVDKGMAKGQSAESVYKKIADDFDRRLNCITGGGCSTTSWWLKPGRYLRLVYNNVDHFGKNAWRTYQIGHQLALEKAQQASKAHDVEALKFAYAINAFASHFIVDRFLSGHIRTPRLKLPRHVNPNLVGNMLTNYMHNEENRYGLHVYNKQGKDWIAYGDRSLLETHCAIHRQILQEVLQDSADQIYIAYKTGQMPKDNILAMLPHPVEINDHSKKDISPMFYWDGHAKKLYRREDLNNPYDRHWTTNWWGISTLYQLRDKNSGNSDQSILALSNYSHEALHHGLITNKEMISYVYHSACS